MGAGAVSGVESAVKGTDVPEFAEAFAKLSDADREKFWDTANKGTPQSAMDEAPEDVKAAFAKLSEENRTKFLQQVAQSLCLAPTVDFLKKAFEMIFEDMTAVSQEVLDNPSGEPSHPIRINEFRDLIKKAFKQHDKDNSETLCPEEAKVFFSAFTVDITSVCNMMTATLIQKQLDAALKELDKNDEMKIKIYKEVYIKMRDDEVQGEKNKLSTYKSNKAERDAAAFKVVDTSGDGTLQWEEFISALSPGSAKYDEFSAALFATGAPAAAAEAEAPAAAANAEAPAAAANAEAPAAAAEAEAPAAAANAEAPAAAAEAPNAEESAS